MAALTPEQVTLKVQLEQILLEFLEDVDFNDARNVTDFYAEDGVFVIGPNRHEGHEGLKRFYADRRTRIADLADGRTSLHTISGVRLDLADADRPVLHFFNTQYSGEGQPPVVGLLGPTMVVRCRVVFRRDASGAWKMAQLEGAPLFVGADPFLNKAVAKR